jgi:methyl halide transferase
MSGPFVRWLIRVVGIVCVASSIVAAWSVSVAAAGEPPHGERLRAEDLLAWQERLARFDEATPKPELLGFERLIAYEENAEFTYAFGQRTAQGENDSPLRFRRVLLVKPGLLIVDDLWGTPDPRGTIRRVGWTAEPIVVAPDGKGVPAGLDQLRWLETNDPVGDPRGARAAETGAADEAATGDASGGLTRTVCLFQVGEANGSLGPVSFESPADGADWKLTVRSADRGLVVELPRNYVAPGWIATAEPGTGTAIARRALPAGILPHGQQGQQLIERWDRAYRGQQRPGWDTGLIADDLKRAVSEGHIKPCRIVELGCGSGTNAIFLASQGFDVTAIDVAPTALGIADAKARKAGVGVRWLLADVLNLPDLGTFDLIFDRGCYHNVRYANAAGFVEAVRQLSHPGSRALIVSLNRAGPPGVLEQTMRDDFSASFDFVWLKESEIQTGPDGAQRRPSWSLMLQRK